MSEDVRADDAVAAGQAALTRGAWADARDRFLDALAVQETPAALEGLSWAAWWLDDADGCLDARVRAYHRYRDAGEVRSAARVALWIGDDHLEFRGEHAVAGGWFARAARLLERLEPGPEHGWLAVFEAHDALERGALDTAGARAGEARQVGRRHGLVDLEMFAIATEGAVLVARGETAEGLRCLDESAAAALSGEYENLAPASWSCCLLMSTCERVRDVDRATQWCTQIDRFSERMHAGFLRGVCRAHHASIQVWHGRWERAERELLEALDDLSTNRPSWRPEAVVRLGQLRRRQGRLDEAEQLFTQAPNHPAALQGLAALHLDRGDPASAVDLLRRVLRQAGDENRAGRADALELLVRVELARGDPGAADRRLEELRSVAGELATEPMTAALRECEGLLAAAETDHEDACDRLEDAIDLFVRSRAPVETARTRIELATSLVGLGRERAAHREVRQALRDLGDIDAAPERTRAHALLARLRTAEEASPEGRSLTDRQIEVLRLVADGSSDQQIAERLTLSRHTVHRHVANIYTRLGCSSRPAAVAEASRRGLL